MSRINKIIVLFCWGVLCGQYIYSMEIGSSREDEKNRVSIYVELVTRAQERMRDIITIICELSVIEPTEAVADDKSAQVLLEGQLAIQLELLENFFECPLLSAWSALTISDKYEKIVFDAADQLSQSWLNFLWELPSGVEQRRFERVGMPFVLPEVVEVLTESALLCKRHKYAAYIKALRTLKDNLEERCLTAADRVVAGNVVNDYIEFARTKKRQLQRSRRASRAKHKSHEAPL